MRRKLLSLSPSRSGITGLFARQWIGEAGWERLKTPKLRRRQGGVRNDHRRPKFACYRIDRLCRARAPLDENGT